MKHKELQDYYLHRMFGQDFDDAERALARQEVNSVINDILGCHDNWPFVRKQVDLVAPAGVNAVALPFDFTAVDEIFVDGVDVDIMQIGDFMKSSEISQRTNIISIFYNETTPYSSHGNVLPTYGSADVKGIGTMWDGTVVGRVFQSGRDGEAYFVDHVESSNLLVLKSCFVGRSQIGRVAVYPDNLSRVVGNPSLNRWSKELEGRLIWLENNGATRTITAVDEAEQVITVNAACDSDDDNIIYSIEDTFEIDPAGAYVLNLWPQPDDATTERQINIAYRRAATHLASDKDNPIIPFNWHHVIEKGLDVKIAINDEASSSRISLLQQFFEVAKDEMKRRVVVEYAGADGAMEPEEDPRCFD